MLQNRKGYVPSQSANSKGFRNFVSQSALSLDFFLQNLEFMINILHLSTSELDGGGARAAYRLHEGLKSKQIDSRMLVRAKSSTDKSTIAEKSLITKLGPTLSGFPLKFYPKTSGMFSSQCFFDVIAHRANQINPDIVHLHWICNGFLQVESLSKLNKPLVWTLHDMWPFTGGCHYTDDCIGYKALCGSCPLLDSQNPKDLSHWTLMRKLKSWKKLNPVIVSPSTWLAHCARESKLFKDYRIEVIPHGLDLNQYKPIERALARQLLNLPQDKKLILFGASSGATGHTRKGFHLLQPALQRLHQIDPTSRLELVVFGATEPQNPVDLGFKTHYLGTFHDDISLALIYSSADVMVVPSIQEAFGQTASEALACGTPVVAFASTGLQDIVEHQVDGYLAQPFAIDDLAQGIAWILKDEDRHLKLRLQARQKAERQFSLSLQASRYLEIYDSLMI
jgi:glycosyltransferase involved in cell wall biosynthesis